MKVMKFSVSPVVKFAGAGDNVFTRLLDDTLHHGIGLGQPLKPFNKLGQVSWVLGLDRHPHDGGNGELHDLHVVSLLHGGDGASLDKELINTDQTGAHNMKVMKFS